MTSSVVTSVRDFKSEFDNSFNRTRMLLNLIGVKGLLPDPKQQDKTFKAIFQTCIGYFILSFTVLSFTFQATYLIGSLTKFVDVVYTLPSLSTTLLNLSKLSTIITNKSKFYNLIKKLKDIWPENFEDNEESRMVESYIANARLTTNIFANVFFTALLFFHIVPLGEMFYAYLRQDQIIQRLPLMLWLPFDSYSTYGYPAAYLFCNMTGFTLIGMVAADILFIIINAHICIQLKMVQSRLQNLVEKANGGVATLNIERNCQDNLEAILRECVKRHNLLISLSNEMEEIFGPSVLVNFLLSSIIICCVGFMLIFTSGFNTLMLVLYLAESMLQVFFLCYFGNQLIDTSSGICDAVYRSSWYATDAKIRRSMQIIMTRAFRPLQITAMKFSVLSLLSFATILSTSYSYYTLLRTFYKQPV